ncbi:MAG: sensor histidine kinase [Stackebrandtia sp.]
MTAETRRQLRNGVLASLITFALGSVLVALDLHSNTNVDVPKWLRFASLATVCFAVSLRRIAPRVGLLIGTAGFAVDTVVGMSIATIAVYTDNIYSATLRGPKYLPRVLLITASAITLGLSAWLYAITDLRVGILICAVFAMILISPVATAMIVREHRERAELERDRAAKIAQLAEVDRRAAVTTERTRMARELHDTIANHLSAIAMRSSAVLARPDMDAEAMRQVMADIRAGSVAGLADMRGTIELLRRGEAEDEVIQHRLSGLEELVTRMKSAGLDVALNITGHQAELPVAVEFAAYRIIQEALTNVLKHGCDARVSLDFASASVTITIDNRVPDANGPVPGSGNGLIGMRERATILGGSFSAGPNAGGWRVHAELPSVTSDKED